MSTRILSKIFKSISLDVYYGMRVILIFWSLLIAGVWFATLGGIVLVMFDAVDGWPNKNFTIFTWVFFFMGWIPIGIYYLKTKINEAK